MWKETDALDLIAMNADGLIWGSETMLEQLSFLGKRIITSLVNKLVGIVSDEKLLELLELAMSADTAETVKRSRELMDSGVDPMVLMSQLAGLIMDIIAGSYAVVNTKPDGSFVGGRSLNETKLERLKNALKLLSEVEKQLRTSSERSTWFTATLLQLLVPYLLQIILSQAAAGGRAARQLKMIHQVVQETFLLSSTNQTSNICLKSQHPLLPT